MVLVFDVYFSFSFFETERDKEEGELDIGPETRPGK